MAAKNIIIKKKIGNDIYELLPKTQDTQVAISNWGTSTVETLASISARIFQTVESWETFKASVNFAGTDSALDTLRELIDTLSNEDVTNGIANQLKALREQIATINTNASTLSGRVDTIETDLNASNGLKARVTTLETGLSTTNGNLTTLTGRVTTAESAINDEDTGLEALAGRINTTNGNVTAVAGRVTTIEGDLNTANTGLKAKVATIESDLNTANTGLKAKVAALDTTVNDADDGLVHRVTNLETASTSLAHVVYVDSNSAIPSSVTSSDIILQEVAAPAQSSGN